MKIIDQNGETLVWTAVYMRYYQEGREECDSLDDAVGFLWGSQDAGLASPTCIVEPSGRVIEGDELDQMIQDLDRKFGR
jgi:hypothetical protein